MPARAVAALTVLLLYVATAAAEERINKAPRDDDVMARVNGATIYRKDVKDIVQSILVMQDTQPDAAAVSKLADDALDSLIALELLYQESQAHGIKVSNADVDAEINRSKSRFPDAQTFQAVLKSRGMTEKNLRNDTQKTMAVDRLLESTVWKDVKVTPEQVKSFYDSNKEEFKHPAQIRVSHILIRVPEGASAADRAAAKKRATALLEQIKAGGDFAALAHKQSEDTTSAPQGGDLGYLAKGEMDDAFEKQAFALTPGQVSEVISTPYGFDILKVTDQRGPGYAPLSEVEDRIRSVLEKFERQKRQADLVAQLRQKAKVELVH